jgi:SAM-dependent methyltransferase
MPAIADTWERGNPYERYIGRWSRRIAPRFLDWLDVPARGAWVDVGCGTGALCAAILDRCEPRSVTGIEPSPGFLATAAENLRGRASLHAGDAASIPLADASADAVVSGLVLNFVPDARAALAEMSRVAVPGGTVAAYVWDYAGRMELIRRFWDVAGALDPAAAALHEGVRFPLCRPEALRSAFENAGLAAVEVDALDDVAVFADFDDYWQPFLGGQGPAPAYAMALDDERRARLRDALRIALPRRADGTIALDLRAFAARGTRPGP